MSSATMVSAETATGAQKVAPETFKCTDETLYLPLRSLKARVSPLGPRRDSTGADAMLRAAR
jgi:hypothetical protein